LSSPPCACVRPCRHELRNLDPFLMLDEFSGTSLLPPKFSANSHAWIVGIFLLHGSSCLGACLPHLSLSLSVDSSRSLQARRVPRPPAQRIRDRHLHARGALRLPNASLLLSSLQRPRAVR
jgi:hypothetical protein